MTAKFRDVVREIARITDVRFWLSRRAQPTAEEENMKWETPEYTVVEVCAEATGYFYRG
ncbi:hypothetical protein ACWEOE_40895 [Amycolatopsis sp. NPDC004368]